MSNLYIELLVKKEKKSAILLLRYVFIGLTISFALVGIMFQPLALFIALIMAGAAYIILMRTDLEYEYLYIDKELSIDKIMAKSKRKKVLTLDISRMEVMAPLQSHQLDSYKRVEGKILDYSTGIVNTPEKRFMIVYDGSKKIIIEPNEAIIKAIRTVAPRKVFVD